MEEKYAVWLSERVKPGTRTMDTLLKTFGSCDAVYAAGKSEYLKAGITSEKTLQGLLDKSLAVTEPIFDSCEKLGVRIIPYGSAEYSNRLANILFASRGTLRRGRAPRSRPQSAFVGRRHKVLHRIRAQSRVLSFG